YIYIQYIYIYIYIYTYTYIHYTLYCQKYWDTPPNHWIQGFQSPPWPKVYKIKHLGLKTASTNICSVNSSMVRDMLPPVQ
ncbi:unnamed protein product, partial [Staurois parvus]